MARAGDDDGDISISFSMIQSHSSSSEELGDETDGLGVQPVSIKQVLESTPVAGTGGLTNKKSRSRLQNQEMHLVVLVAAVIRVEHLRNNSIQVDLQDGGRGLLHAYWNLNELNKEEIRYVNNLEIEESSYIRVIGCIIRPQRESGPGDDDPPVRNYLKVKWIRNIVDPHEIFYHVLEVIRLTKEREMSQSSTKVDKGKSRMLDLVNTIDCLHLSYHDSQESSSTRGKMPSQPGPSSSSSTRDNTVQLSSSPNGDADPKSHLSNLERAIHVFLLSAKGEGRNQLHIQEISHGVKALRRTPIDILGALDSLVERGFIQLADEVHYELVDEEIAV